MLDCLDKTSMHFRLAVWRVWSMLFERKADKNLYRFEWMWEFDRKA